MSTTPLLEAQNIRRRFGHVYALDGANFAVYPGEICALIGDNGAGKSTLIKILSGADRPDEGRILIEGREISLDSPSTAQQLGIATVYQDLARRYLTHDSKKFRREMLHAADERQSAALLELTGLLSTIDGAFGEADDFFQHASALFPKPADQFRCKLYGAELALRKGDSEEGRQLLQTIMSNPKFSQLPGLAAAQDLKKTNGGK